MDELFGGGAKSAPQPKWINVDDVHVGVIVDEPSVLPVTDFVTKKNKWMGKLPDERADSGFSWKVFPEGEVPKEAVESFQIKQIKVPVQIDGVYHTFYFDGQKKEALKAEMEKTGIALTLGVTVAVKFVAEQATKYASKKKLFAVRLVAAG